MPGPPWRLVEKIDGAPAAWGAALAIDPVDLLVETVINRQFFSALDVTQTHVKNVAFYNAGGEVGLARMIDVFGPGAAHRPVDGPVVIQGE